LRADLAEHIPVDPQDRTARRRRSLHRGMLRWIRDVCADGQRVQRVLLFSLTVAELEPDPAQGAMRQLMKQLRDTRPGLRYAWWAEFQKRGAIHFHGILVDPPFGYLRDARHWFQARWPLAAIQPWVEWRSAAWYRSSAGAYALKDVRKLNGKRYEQDYSRMPKGWRTFSTHHLTFSAAEHQEHEDLVHTVCTAAPDSPWHERVRQIWIYRVDYHVPATGGCRLRQRRRPVQPGGPAPPSARRGAPLRRRAASLHPLVKSRARSRAC
jgi:hypothetical protein